MIIEYLIHGLEFNKTKPNITVVCHWKNDNGFVFCQILTESLTISQQCLGLLDLLVDAKSRISNDLRTCDGLSSRYRISAPCTLQCLCLPIYDTKSHAFLWPDVILRTHRFMEEQDADPTKSPPMPCTKRNKAPKVGPAHIPNEQVNWRIVHFPKSSLRNIETHYNVRTSLMFKWIPRAKNSRHPF